MDFPPVRFDVASLAGAEIAQMSQHSWVNTALNLVFV